MKPYLSLLLISLILLSSATELQLKPLHGKRVLILGNSITQNGRYVDYLEYYLRQQHPEEKVDIISIGLSSETASGASEANHPFPRPCVHSRLDDALALIKPDVVLASYGMNDGIFSNPDPDLFEAYKNGIVKLKDKVEANGATLILLTPTPFDPDPIQDRISMDGAPHAYKTPYYKYDNVLKEYAEWLTTLNNVQVIDLYTYLSQALANAKKLKSDSTFIPDGVHPNDHGHHLMAKKILEDLYPEIKTGESSVEPVKLNDDALFELVSTRRQERSEGWRNYVGYTKGKTVKSEDITETIKAVENMEEEIQKMISEN